MFISATQLAKRLAVPALRAQTRIIDTSWHLGDRNAALEFEHERIPSALFFDLDQVCDQSSPLPHMLPSPSEFEQAMQSLGITNKSFVCIYATKGSFAAPRCWWTFKYFGHEDVCILDGGLPAWKEAGEEIESGEVEEKLSAEEAQQVAALPYVAVPNTKMVVNMQDILANVAANPRVQVADARPLGRFLGTDPEPREGIPSGHIPGSLSLPGTHVLNEDFTRLKSAEEIESALRAVGVDVDGLRARSVAGKEGKGPALITTCGSGVTAAVLTVAVHKLTGLPLSSLPVYDGSWTEYASSAGENPID